MGRIYLDYAATTPVDPRVFKVMQPYFVREFGNPGSLHSFGQAAIAAVDDAREKVARALGGDFREIIFTGSATEANNLALRGVVKAASSEKRESNKPLRIVVSSVEHESVLETARDLEQDGIDAVYLPVDEKGIVKLDALKKSLTPETVLVSVMYVNNETGAIQPIKEISKIIRDFRTAAYPLFHTDAAQALYTMECIPAELGVDLMTVSGQKIYGPKGVGTLYISKTARRPEPVITGGGQEFGLRSATENVPAIAGFGEAARLAVLERARNERHIRLMRELFLKGIRKIVPKAKASTEGAPHILNIWMPGYPAEDTVMRFDRLGIAVSAGSACKSRAPEPSYVLEAMGFSASRVKESIRVSFGKDTTSTDIKKVLRAASKIFGGS